MKTTNNSKKTLGKLKLNKLNENKLEKSEMKILKGGCECVANSNYVGYH